jgi:segregation and condensation protein A
VLERVNADDFTSFTDFFDPGEGRMGVVVSFIAILELLKESLIEIVQSKPYGPIYVKAST